jgi:hypothetical protein
MNKTASPNYSRWAEMHRRCTNPAHPAYAQYGGRGIRVCARWDELANFDADMGYPPTPNHSIERIDVNGHYEPGNCTWATPREQARNRTNNVLHQFEGKHYFLQDLAEEKGVSFRTLDDRIRRQGMTLEEALSKPTTRQGSSFVEVDGVKMSKAQAARKFGISPTLLSQRLNKGMSVKEALTKPRVITGRPRNT